MEEKKLHHRAKLTDEQVRQLREQYQAHVVGYATLAKKYGCGVSTVRDIVNYYTRPGAILSSD
jgi:DNA invertase Pin-like site-specific DNA recombinase